VDCLEKRHPRESSQEGEFVKPTTTDAPFSALASPRRDGLTPELVDAARFVVLLTDQAWDEF